MSSTNDYPKPISFTKEWHTKPYAFISPSRPELSAAGKNVVITGGGSGIGNAIAVAFAQASAKSVSILGRRLETLKLGAEKITTAATEAHTSTQVFYETADLRQRSAVDEALASIVSRVGKIDIFVSNAGTLPTPGLIREYDVEDYLGGVVENIRSALNAVQGFLAVAGPDPVLLNTSSCLANIAPMPGVSGYAVSKAAVLKMIEYVAAENPYVRVVSAQPGWVATEVNGYQAEAPDQAELPGQFYVWLASAEAEFLKGKFVWVNWDAEELVKRAEEIRGSKLLNWIVEGVPM
ncbi:SDR family NAD(P)-dependent oxidoreductase [Aspergillus aculeatinus CBS 121060]|uniref:Short-chain dehydrogenase n=1 Tax=Aspergillus aculeatinus CBS 121060 TaxID=1448322 RepID=A0ACD1HNT6_9EURO|nr:putative short-chain dehydrogenase [Aspergillus aculeatinus CBS 121060]RAH75085.1 putative short-chain dehydrogenase [Aspergillus aculeatinus CBS 121060]